MHGVVVARPRHDDGPALSPGTTALDGNDRVDAPVAERPDHPVHTSIDRVRSLVPASHGQERRPRFRKRADGARGEEGS